MIAEDIINEILEDDGGLDFIQVFVHCEECNGLIPVDFDARAPHANCWVCVEKRKLKDVKFWRGRK